MSKYFKIEAANRVIDANINRSKEGLRVCEEIARFILNNRSLTSAFKKIRHRIDAIIRKDKPNRHSYSYIELIKERKSTSDIGQNIYINELKRNNIQDIFFANIQRAKEAIRVLEEFSKLINTTSAIRFKRIRYEIYEIEKRSVKEISSLCNRR